MKFLNVYHKSDLDGWFSGAIVKHAFQDNQFDTLYQLGYEYGDEIPNIIYDFDGIIMTDIIFDDMEVMLKLAKQYGKEFYYIDHHANTIKKLQKMFSENDVEITMFVNMEDDDSKKMSACELTYLFFNTEPLPQLISNIGAFDCFRHTTFTPEKEEEILYHQFGASANINSVESAYIYYTNPIGVVDSFIKEGKSIKKYLDLTAQDIYKTGFVVNINTDDGVKKFIAINKERFNPNIFGINYTEEYDGAVSFHYVKNKWKFSIYSEKDDIDCAVIASQFGGGGHKGAAGFHLNDINDFFKLKNNEMNESN